MNGSRKSDELVVPEKSPNKGGGAPTSAEAVEGRSSAKENPDEVNRVRTQRRTALQSELDRVREVARRDKDAKFTALWHHVYNIDRLREAYLALEPKAAAGVDGETWQTYGTDLEARLQDLSARLKRGAYRAKPVRRVYIPKADGRQRPIGVPALEDKIVQRATVEVLNAVYEMDFLGFSYGFRPGRNQHQALDALAVAITEKKVNWVLDADIRGFFDNLDHEWLIKYIEHRIADSRVVRHVQKWLHAGVLEDGHVLDVERGTPQGGSISPLLANIYLHYALDRWVDHWRKSARGEVIFVRYADDFVVGFEHRDEGLRFLAELKGRLKKFGLELHPEKTRLIEFGRFAKERRERRGQGKPEVFDFLGFTHVCGERREGGFALWRWTARGRLQRKLKEVGSALQRRIHMPVGRAGRWLRAVLRGYYNYYAVPSNYKALSIFRHGLVGHWYRALRRRSQRTRLTWERMKGLAEKWLPRPKILHPWPNERFHVKHPRQEPGAVIPPAGI